MNKIFKELLQFFTLTIILTLIVASLIFWYANANKDYNGLAVIMMFIPATSASLVMYQNNKTTYPKLLVQYFIIAYLLGIILYIVQYFVKADFASMLLMCIILAFLIVVSKLKKSDRDQFDICSTKNLTRKNFFIFISLIIIFYWIIYLYNGLFFKTNLSSLDYLVGLLQMSISSALFGFISFGQFFGEEYGWRSFLQPRLTTLFKTRITKIIFTILITGIVWGIWHTALQYNYLEDKSLFISNMLMYICFTITMSSAMYFIYAKFKNVIYCAILHLLHNGFSAFQVSDGTNPTQSITTTISYLAMYLFITIVFIF